MKTDRIKTSGRTRNQPMIEISFFFKKKSVYGPKKPCLLTKVKLHIVEEMRTVNSSVYVARNAFGRIN